MAPTTAMPNWEEEEFGVALIDMGQQFMLHCNREI
jgi:cell division ATPase FtsA